MAEGRKSCRRIQIGLETTPGTAVAATTYWRGTGTLDNNQTTVFPEEDVGIFGGTDRNYIPKVEAGITLESVPATYQQLPYLFEMGIEHATPTTDEGDAYYEYLYTMPLSCTDLHESTDLGTYTIEAGDNIAAEEFAYGVARSITLSGRASEAVMMSAELFGREVSTSEFTDDLSIPSVTEILMSHGSLYIDDADGTIGTTAISNTLLDMNLSINTGWRPIYTAEGNKYFSFAKQGMPEIICTLTFEHNATAVTEKANWNSLTARLLRLKFDGGSGYELYLDMAGKWDNVSKLGERDGNNILTFTFRVRYNSTAAKYFSALVQPATLASLA